MLHFITRSEAFKQNKKKTSKHAVEYSSKVSVSDTVLFFYGTYRLRPVLRLPTRRHSYRINLVLMHTPEYIVECLMAN